MTPPREAAPHWGHALLTEPAAAGRARCLVCPHRCALASGEVGLCGVRGNVDGRIANLVYGRVAAFGAEPIEKKPVFHFYPGHRTFSLGAAGCNLRCDFCQNWEISQAAGRGAVAGRELSPAAAVAAALAASCQSLCFTFTEAVVNLEYVIDVAQLARAEGLWLVVLTGGYVSETALALLSPHVDCVKLDLKGPDDAFYRAYVGGRLAPVLAAWRGLARAAWVEVSTVLPVGGNDADEAIRRMAEMILATTGPDTPWHLMRFFPSFRLSGQRPGALDGLRRARLVARQAGLRHVYVSNVPGLAEADTYCPGCGASLVSRRVGRIVNNLEMGVCARCRTEVAGCWSPYPAQVRQEAL